MYTPTQATMAMTMMLVIGVIAGLSPVQRAKRARSWA
jgi:hypothetical protein